MTKIYCSNVRPLDKVKNFTCSFVRLVCKYPITSCQRVLPKHLSQFLMTTAFSPAPAMLLQVTEFSFLYSLCSS